jgi:hypothetical protein
MTPRFSTKNLPYGSLGSAETRCDLNLSKRSAQGENGHNIRSSEPGIRVVFAAWLVAATLLLSVDGVIEVRSEKQVTWPHARRVVAFMEYVQPIWN